MHSRSAPPRPFPPGRLAQLRRCAMVALAMVAATRVCAQASSIGPPAPGLSETGAPAFVILSPAALGLSSPPTDLQALPDGRILALAGKELAIGDGTRWEVFRLAPEETAGGAGQVAIDRAGNIFTCLPDAFVRVEFGVDGHWRRIPVAPTPRPNMALTSVHVIAGQWYWHGGSGATIAWQPGKNPTIVGQITDAECALRYDGHDYLSDRADGSFWRVTPTGLEPAIASRATNVSRAITCGLDLGEGQFVVGTNGRGLQRFDGAELRPFLNSGPLSGNNRVNDLCVTVPGLFAAAVDNIGLILFDRHGRTVQVLDRVIDHRLARVRRLFYARHGAIWALLNDGIARIEFPSRISHYEPMVSTGLVFAQPFRHEGRLWLLSDGQAQRGIYDADGRLLRFEVDSPPDQFLCSLSTATGALLASGPAGIFRLERSGWALVVPGVTNAHLANYATPDGRWAFFAENLVGWIRPAATTYEVRLFPAPGVGGVYGAVGDATGVLWAELGTARVGRFDPSAPEPRGECFGPDDGLAGGWAQIALFGGEVRINIAGRILRFDAARHRFEPDTAFTHDLPAAIDVVGRPATDARGRFWLAAGEQLHLYERSDHGLRPLNEKFPSGLLPLFFTPDDSGPVWLHQRLHLARYDPDMPLPEPGDPRVLITRVHLTASDRTIHLPRGELPTLPASDNSLTLHYLAVDAPPAQPVTFEYRLIGTHEDWVSSGPVGSASFNQLKEGTYAFLVRPLLGDTPGRETRLSFVVEPPWFRTRTAYAAYALAALAFVALVAWYAAWRERRDKARLEALVAQRTRELNDANLQLAGNMAATLRQADELRASEERYRQLSAELEHRVQERTEDLVRANEQLVASNQELESFSYSISHDLRAPLRNINGFVDLLRRRNRGTLDSESSRFFQIITTETIRLSQLIDSLLAFARLNRSDFKLEPVALSALVAQVVAELRPEYENRLIVWRVGPMPIVMADATLLRQVVANLLHNAVKFTRNRPQAVIEIGAPPPAAAHPHEQVVSVRDNGAGFDPKYTEKLFGVFQRLHNVRDFEGTGIGLANAKRIILRHGGRIWAEGHPGQGATFFFSLPLRSPERRG